MDQRFSGLLTLTILFLFFTLPQSATAERIIIINETQQHVFALSDMLVSGDLEANSLRISGSGEILSGKNVKVYLLGAPSDILIQNLNVNGRPASISFDEKGYFFVHESGLFDYSGELMVRTAGQVVVRIPGPLNQLRFELENGYPIGGDFYGMFNDQVIIQRTEKTSQLVSGAFQYAFAERDTFRYQIDYKAYGKSLGRAELSLRNGEEVLTVSGAKDYSVQGGKLILELTGSQANVVVTGTFSGKNLGIPLAEGSHHILIESDPERKISISTYAKELDLSESPIRPAYANGRVFLASPSDSLKVTVKTLEMFESLAASVKTAENRIAITSKGSMLGELYYRYANTGVDYIEIDAPGQPLYASTQSRPIKLTKEDNLLLSLPKSEYGNLDLIYFTTDSPLGLLSVIDVPVANTMLPITEMNTEIYLPADYFVVETLGAPGGSELPSLQSIVVFMLLVGGLGYMVREDKIFAASYIVFSAALMMFSTTLFLIAIIASIGLAVRRSVGKQSLKWMIAGAAGLIALSLVVIVFFGILASIGSYGTEYAQVRSDYADVDMYEESAPMLKSMAVIGDGAGAVSVPTREGVLPVKLELPYMGKSVSVTNYLVTRENPVSLTLILVSSKLKYLAYLIGFGALLLCKKQYQRV
ncbi:MAG TPA: hypothetical protein ENN13_04895 [Candidatus Altiarchaeales archaeon]|nr:hypothetical protein [Candidatus Altiarchaeales archaeon]